MIEVHPDPDRALSDGAQSLYPEQFEELMQQIRVIAAAIGRDRRVADYWIAHRGDPLDLYRFDAVAITTHGGNQLIEHVEDAWGI
jgi:Holliday junction resolvase-like predicted endonuclease